MSSLDHLRQGIHLRSYAQKNPKQEYKKEAPKKKVSNLEKVRAREAAAKASGKIKDKTTDTKDE